MAAKKTQSEAEQVEAQQQAAVDAAESRAAESAKEAEKAAADAPPELAVRGGRTEPKYTHARLVEDAEAFVGHPSYVVAGALSSVPDEYLSVDDAKQCIQAFLERRVNQEA